MMQNGYRTRPSLAPLTLEVLGKLNLSASETEGMSLRDVKCPHCGFVITKVFSDMCGHYLARCRKCKREQPINLAYFRRQKDVWRLKLKYYGEEYFEKLNNE